MYYSTWIEFNFFFLFILLFVWKEIRKKDVKNYVIFYFVFFKSYGSVGGYFWIVMWAYWLDSRIS